jgi:hypothetical protein
MDPNFIHLDWERTFDALMLVVLFAIIVERALSVLFQSQFYIEHLHRDGLKETLAVVASIALCAYWKLDAVGMILLTETTTVPGYLVTGALVAGGSKGSLKLFQDFFDLQSTAFKMRHALQAAQAAEAAKEATVAVEAAPTKAAAEVAKAKVDAAVMKVKVIAAKAATEGTVVPATVVAAAEEASTMADLAVAAKR